MTALSVLLAAAPAADEPVLGMMGTGVGGGQPTRPEPLKAGPKDLKAAATWFLAHVAGRATWMAVVPGDPLRRGTVRVGDAAVAVALVDGNFSGTYDDRTAPSLGWTRPGIAHHVVGYLRGRDPLEVAAGETTTIAFGPPLVAEVTVRQMGDADPRRVRFDLALKGRGGERYLPALSKNGMPSRPPEFDVVDETGNVRATGTFEFG